MIIYILLLIIATALFVFWGYLILSATTEDFDIAAYNKIFNNREEIKKLLQKNQDNTEALKKYSGIVNKILQSVVYINKDKQIEKLAKNTDKIMNGNYNDVGVLDIPGYVFLRKYNIRNSAGLYKICVDFFGRKHAENRTKYFLAKTVSYIIIGTSLSISIATITLCNTDEIDIATIFIVAMLPIISVLYPFSLISRIKGELEKKRENITRQFPNVVSKLALLVTSGMIVDKAWKETANSSSKEIYLEMQLTSKELDNLVSPASAYREFTVRCNTKETTKLASAIIQNMSKGNAELGDLLKTMSEEAWLERKHLAKRDSEKANSKLMIPLMILLADILFMIMVPIVANMQ